MAARNGVGAGLTGKIVDADGEPWANELLLAIDAYQIPKRTAGSFPDEFYTDKDGRFRLTTLTPGVNYSVRILKNQRILDPVFDKVVLKPGETRDLGVIKAKKPID